MTAKRLVALVAAVLMIVGAIVARNAIDNRNSSTDSSSPTSPTSPSKGVLDVVCSTEFISACQDLQAVYGASLRITTEPAGTTLDRLASVSANSLPDLWITLAPFPAMLDATRSDGAVVVANEVVAHTTPQLTMLADRAAALRSTCANATLWRCVGEIAGSRWSDHDGVASWGTIKPGLIDPTNEAAGLLALGTAVGGYFGAAQFSRNTWEADPEFLSWIRNLSSRSRLTTGKTPLATLITQASALNIAATDAAEVARTSRAQDAQFETVIAAPAVSLLATAASFTSTDAALRAKVIASLGGSLTGTYRWEQGADATPTPDAGTFIALRQLWKELT